MCYRPLRIKNPKIESENSDLNATVDKLYITVPCGSCGECRTNKQDDIYLRTNAEFNMIYPGNNISYGFVMFNTLTFDEDNVPMYHGFRCFDSKKIVNFIKRLRISLEREYNIPGSNLHYLFVSEYGSDTARPHYHPLFFLINTGQYDSTKLPGTITPEQFGQLVERQWPYGFVQTSNPYDPKYYHNYDECLVKDQSGCIKYVSKYCVKDFDFLYVLNRQKPKEFIDYLESLLNEKVEDIDYHLLFKALPRSEYLRFMPHQKMSHHFGENLVNYDIHSLMKGYIMLPDKEKGQKAYRVPQYIDRKLFYNMDKDTHIYTLNKLGMEMKCIRMQYNQRYVTQSTDNILYHWYEYMDLGKRQETLSLMRKYISYDLNTPDDVTDYIQTLLDGRPLQDYVNYILLYKDYIKPVHTDIYTSDIGFDAFRILGINYESQPRYLTKSQCYTYIKDFFSRCDSMYEFRYFNDIYKLYDFLRNRLGCYRQRDYIFEQRLKSETKYNNIKHYGKL